MTDDIVARLRDCDGGYGFRAIVREAADEIERLREALRIEREEAAACAIDRKETQRERDDARRIVCDMIEGSGFDTKEQIAAERGWDCFKEATDGR